MRIQHLVPRPRRRASRSPTAVLEPEARDWPFLLALSLLVGFVVVSTVIAVGALVVLSLP